MSTIEPDQPERSTWWLVFIVGIMAGYFLALWLTIPWEVA